MGYVQKGSQLLRRNFLGVVLFFQGFFWLPSRGGSGQERGAYHREAAKGVEMSFVAGVGTFVVFMGEW
jgi:hypothetical protein